MSKQALGNALAGVAFLVIAVVDFTRDSSGAGVAFLVFAAVFFGLDHHRPSPWRSLARRRGRSSPAPRGGSGATGAGRRSSRFAPAHLLITSTSPDKMCLWKQSKAYACWMLLSPHVASLPCRRSWVRIPSSALRTGRKAGFFVGDQDLLLRGWTRRRAKRATPYPAAMTPAVARPIAFVVRQLRQALQQTAAVGTLSPYLLTA